MTRRRRPQRTPDLLTRFLNSIGFGPPAGPYRVRYFTEIRAWADTWAAALDGCEILEAGGDASAAQLRRDTLAALDTFRGNGHAAPTCLMSWAAALVLEDRGWSGRLVLLAWLRSIGLEPQGPPLVGELGNLLRGNVTLEPIGFHVN